MLTLGVAAHALTGLVDLQLIGTTYEEGVMVYVAGGAVLVAFGGVCHWGPKLWGRKLASGAVLPLVGLGRHRRGARRRCRCSSPGSRASPTMAVGGFDYELAPEALNLLARSVSACCSSRRSGFVLSP